MFWKSADVKNQIAFVSLNELFLPDTGGEPDAYSYNHLYDE